MPPSDKFDTVRPAATSVDIAELESKPEHPIETTADRLSLKLDFSLSETQPDISSAHPHVLFFPLHYEPGYSYPLVVWLHGHGGDERQIMRIMPQLSMRNYVAVAPQGFPVPPVNAIDPSQVHRSGRTSERTSEHSWNTLDVNSILKEAARSKVSYDWFDSADGVSEAEQRIFDCISIAKKRNNIAPDRVFLAGFGSGGTMALRLGLFYPECFAGVASLGGGFPKGRNVLHRWTTARHLAVYLGFGQTSTTFSPNEACQTLELFHTAGVPVTAREYGCGQELVPQMFQDLNRWMMGLVCGG